MFMSVLVYTLCFNKRRVQF